MKRITAQLWLTVLTLNLPCSADSRSNENTFHELLPIRRMIGQGEYGVAFEKCVSLLDKKPASVQLYDLLVEVGCYALRIREVDSLLEMRVYEGIDVGRALYGQGQSALKKGEWTEALERFDRSIDHGLTIPNVHAAREYAFEKLYGVGKAVEHFLAQSHREPRSAGIWYSLALAYWSLLDAGKALAAVTEAVRLAPNEAKYRQLLAGIKCSWIMTPDARRMAIREIEDAIASGDVDGAAFVRWCVIDALYATGQWNAAISMAEEANRSVCEFGQLRWRAHLHLLLARLHLSLGTARLAMEHADLASKYFGVVDDIDGCLSSRAFKIGILLDTGDLSGALRYSFGVLIELSDQSDTRLWGSALIDASWTLCEIGESRLALALGIEAQRILQQCPYSVYDQIRMNTALGLVHQRSGDCEVALRYQRLALELSEHSGAARNAIATCEGKLATSMLILGDTVGGLLHLRKQLKAARLAKDPAEEKEALLIIGGVEAARSQYASAKNKLCSALEIARNQNDNRAMRVCYLVLGRIAERENERGKAMDYYLRAAKCLQNQRHLRYHMLLTQETRNWFLAQQGDLVHALCRTGQGIEAFALMETARRDISLELLCHLAKRNRRDALRFGDDTASLYARLAQKRRAISSLIDSRESVWTTLLPLLNDYFSLADTLSRLQELNSPTESDERGGNLDPELPYHVRRDLLSEEDLLLEFWIGETVLERFAVTTDTVVHSSVRIGRDRLSELIGRGLNSQGEEANFDRNPVIRYPHVPAHTDHRLSQAILGGIEDLLRGKHRLKVVADEPLVDATFDLLEYDQSDRRVQLVERHAISYASTVFMYDSSFRIPSMLPLTILVLADPVSSGHPSDIADLISAVRSGGKHELYRLSLPTAQREADVVKSVFGKSCELRVGSLATEKALKRASSHYRIVHIASHCAARTRAGEDHAVFLSADDESDGVLTHDEIAKLDLRCDLVVLSGCNAGRSSTMRDWTSLARAFVEAGTASVVAADKRIQDVLTDEFFGCFYQHLQIGEPISTALQMAKRSLINEGFKDARLWAGFRLYGGDGPVLSQGMESEASQPLVDHLTVLGALFMVVVFAMVERVFMHERRK